MVNPRGNSDSIHLQDRDFSLLRGLFESRIMTIRHAAALYFNGSREAAKKRLQKLKAAGLISERKRQVNESSILFLSRKGHVLLATQGLLLEFPQLSPSAFEKRANVSDLTLRHELEVMDVKAAFYDALRKFESFRIVEFSTWPRLNEFKARRSGLGGAEVLVKPDGFIRIQERDKAGAIFEHTFFLEVDRSTETQATLVSRVNCYLDYYKSGEFAVRNGASRSAFKEFPFRVLIVLKNPERRNNTTARLLQNNPPILSLAYLSTIEEILKNPVNEVWIRPIDYHEATKKRAFENGIQTSAYTRRIQSKEFGPIKKLMLLDLDSDA